jgi:hypothetical protein
VVLLAVSSIDGISDDAISETISEALRSWKVSRLSSHVHSTVLTSSTLTEPGAKTFFIREVVPTSLPNW